MSVSAEQNRIRQPPSGRGFLGETVGLVATLHPASSGRLCLIAVVRCSYFVWRLRCVYPVPLPYLRRLDALLAGLLLPKLQIPMTWA